MYNQIATKLNKACKYAFMQLHNAFGFDFEEPFNMVYHEGNFTITSARKLLGVEFDNFIIIIRNPENYCRRDRFMVVKAVGSGFDIVEGRALGYYNNFRQSLDDYCRKSDFNDDRKSTKAQAYFLYQAKEYRRPVKPTPRPSYYIRRNDIVFDKCGNNITDRRNDLMRRAEALRRERARAAYLETNDTAKVKELENRIAAAKAAIIKELEKAATPDEFDKVGKKCEGWHGLRWIVWHFESYKKRTAEKDYPSVKAANEAYNEIFNELENLTKGEI
jgi:hypothetical protein